jgi:hypothetical protein
VHNYSTEHFHRLTFLAFQRFTFLPKHLCHRKRLAQTARFRFENLASALTHNTPPPLSVINMLSLITPPLQILSSLSLSLSLSHSLSLRFVLYLSSGFEVLKRYVTEHRSCRAEQARIKPSCVYGFDNILSTK